MEDFDDNNMGVGQKGDSALNALKGDDLADGKHEDGIFYWKKRKMRDPLMMDLDGNGISDIHFSHGFESDHD